MQAVKFSKDVICMAGSRVTQNKKKGKNLRRNNDKENKELIDKLNFKVKMFSNENRRE